VLELAIHLLTFSEDYSECTVVEEEEVMEPNKRRRQNQPQKNAKLP
jgi:hypothetical protein